MHASLQDLRMLYLAHEVERAFEGLEKALHRHLPEEIKSTLMPLFEGGPGHRELEMQLARLNAEVEAQRDKVTVEDLLQALLDCERTARDFYLHRKDDLTDPRLAKLFATLAAEEGRHLEAVEKAMVLCGFRSGKI